MKYFFILFFFAVLGVVSLAGFRGHRFTSPPVEVFPDMDDQAKVKYQTRSDFFADGVGARKPVAGTVPMGFAIPEVPVSEGGAQADYGFTHADDYLNTGRFGDYWGDGIPEEIEVDAAFLARGLERYGIYCAVCHGESGNGKGVTARYGVPNIANFHLDHFRDPAHPDYRTDGSIYHTITNGKGLMGSYGAVMTVRDRWAVVAYLRALQAGWQVPHADVAEEFEAQKNAGQEAAAE